MILLPIWTWYKTEKRFKMLPILIPNGVISGHGNTCIACGAKADMHNVLGAYCGTHKDNFVKEFRTLADLDSLNIIQNPILREHIVNYVKQVWNP